MVTDPGITTRCPVDLPLVDEQNADSGNALSAEESKVTTAGCDDFYLLNKNNTNIINKY